MPLILIADAGSTFTDWSLITQEGKVISFTTEGINPVVISEDNIRKTLLKVKQHLESLRPEKVFYFGAGCLDESYEEMLQAMMAQIFENTTISVKSDMMGAAIALFGEKSGVAGIIGTGSNSCLYYKGKMIDKIPALGYILGDEGSGAAIGKRFINAIFKRQLSPEITQKFLKKFKFSYGEIITQVYKGEKPAAFLASLCPFILKNINQPDVRALVKEEFRNYFQKNILPYFTDKPFLPIGLIGSVAFYFRKIIKEVALEFGITKIKIIKKPLLSLEIFYFKKYYT